jgi:hypothetical protein
MSFLVLDIPEQNAELAPWLERQLVGLHLADLVAELEAFQVALPRGGDLQKIFGGDLDNLLEDGLAAASEQQIRDLLGHPRLLIELQELVLLEGGPRWDEVPLAEEHERLTAECWERVSAAHSPAVTPRSSLAGGTATAPRRFPWAAALSAAALLLIAFFGWREWSPPQSTGWGWNKPGALADSGSAHDYLLQLADGAGDWFNQRPETPEALATRLEQFQNGCQHLIEAPHRPLSPEDKAWLIERCRAWSSKLDEHIAKSKAAPPGGDVDAVRAEADATINKLIDALRKRAEQVA